MTTSNTARDPETRQPWVTLVQRIGTGDPVAIEEFYRIFRDGLRAHFRRHLGYELVDEAFHDVMVQVIERIRSGEIREPNRMAGYVHTVAQRYIASQIDYISSQRRKRVSMEGFDAPHHAADAEACLLERERHEIAKRILRSMGERDREVLIRFYLKEESPEQIQRSLNISNLSFRVTKSRAKARFTELCHQAMHLNRARSEIRPTSHQALCLIKSNGPAMVTAPVHSSRFEATAM